MKEILLEVSELNAQTITNLFLYGTKETPSFEKLKDGSFLDREDITLHISDMDKYMSTFGRFANASMIEKVQNFFNENFGKDHKKGERQEFTFKEMKGKKNYATKQMYFKGTDKQEWAERTYIFNSQTYFLTQNVKFIIDENGNKYIENFAMIPGVEDFDFEGTTLSNFGNILIENDIDPYRIGKTLKITYPSHKKGGLEYNDYGKGRIYTISDYKNDKERYIKQNHGISTELLNPMYSLVDKLWDKGVTKFIDNEGKTIVCGTSKNDFLSSGKLYGKIKNYYEKNKTNGIVFVGGKGADKIIGTEYNDIIYGHDKLGIDDDGAKDKLMGGKGSDKLFGGKGDDILDGGRNRDPLFKIRNGTDELYGGDGNDTYVADDGDFISDSDGIGKVYFAALNGKKTLLTGGIWNKEKKAYIDKTNKDISYTLSDDGILTVKNGDDKITIKNYDKKEKSLNIELKDIQGQDVAFVIDTTGSMWDDIASVKANAISIINSLFNKEDLSVNSRVAVVGYNDPSVSTVQTFTSDKASALSAINSLGANGGGDYPEMVYSGLLRALNGGIGSWRKEATARRIFLFGDAPGKDTNLIPLVNKLASGLGLSTRSVQTQNVNSNIEKLNISFSSNDGANTFGVEIFTIAIGGASGTASEFNQIAEQTGGLSFNANGATDIADVLFDAINTGTNSNDTIIGNNKNNIVNGGRGDDILKGDLGSDTYRFDLDFGKDTIIETNKENKDKNIIQFVNKDIGLKDLRFNKSNNDLIIKNNENQITIKDFYTDEQKISSIEFSDKTKLDYQDIVDIVSLQSNKDIIKFANKDENYLDTTFKEAYFKADDNTSTHLSGGLFDDSLIGGNKNDELWGETGNDSLQGSKGDDKLYGGLGDDNYIFKKGDGKDSIYDDGGRDMLFLRDIDKDDVILTQNNNDLVIDFKSSDDSITIKEHFRWIFGNHNKLESIRFDDGTYIHTSELKNKNIISCQTIETIIHHINAYATDDGFCLSNTSQQNNQDLTQIVMSGWQSV